MPDRPLPLPPSYLAARVGTVDDADPFQFYLEEGARLRDVIEGQLPEGWDWAGKRVLDFGCGSARVLRHFAREAENARFHGCDIDRRSIAWDAANLSPPFRFFRNGPAPPLSLPSGELDLIWAMSVFTHITDSWADWLVEMHRLLAPGGLLIASFLGDGMWEALVHESYREDQVGMTVLRYWDGPEAWVFHSEWWLREHWGRAFEVESVTRPPRAADGSPQITHSYIALRRRECDVTAAELERVDATEARELAGFQTGIRLHRRELAELGARRSGIERLDAIRRQVTALIRQAPRPVRRG